MSYSYRCNRNNCRARRTLKKLITQYVKTPTCECGGNLHRDKWVKPYTKRNTCYCGGVLYPHNQWHVGCDNYKGSRDLEHEAMLEELGAVPVVAGEGVPF